MRVLIEIQARNVDEVQRNLRGIAGGAGRVMVRALNDTMRFTRTRIVDAVYQRIVLTKAVIRDTVKLRGASPDRLAANVDVRSKRMTLIRFGAKQVRRGVTYRISRSGKRELIEHAFIAKGKGVLQSTGGDNLQVFVREDDPGGPRSSKKTGLVWRKPLDVLRAVSPVGVLEETAGLINQIEAQASEKLVERLQTHTALLIERGR